MASSQKQLIKDILGWGKDQGVVLEGVKAKAIPNRGIGIVSTRALKPGDIIMTIPLKVTRNIKNTRPFIVSRTIDAGVSNFTVHSSLAADLVISLGSSPRRTGTDGARNGFDGNPWLEALPSYRDLAKTIPYFFPAELQALLPKPARNIIAKQNSAIDRDFAILSKIDWPGIRKDNSMTKEQFIHAWFIVNTRTFYYVAPGQEAEELPWNDQMALVPIADFINHDAGEGCGVGFSEEGYAITAEREFEKGEELSLCYGRHNNDELMAEYGFIIDGEVGTGNKWDVVDLEETIVEVGSRYLGRQIGKEELEGKNIRIDWEGNVDENVMEIIGRLAGDEDDDELGEVGERASAFLNEILRALHQKYLDVLAQYENHGEMVGKPSQWDILLRRWGQIDGIVAKARKSAI